MSNKKKGGLIGICNQEISAFTFHLWSVLDPI